MWNCLLSWQQALHYHMEQAQLRAGGSQPSTDTWKQHNGTRRRLFLCFLFRRLPVDVCFLVVSLCLRGGRGSLSLLGVVLHRFGTFWSTLRSFLFSWVEIRLQPIHTETRTPQQSDQASCRESDSEFVLLKGHVTFSLVFRDLHLHNVFL